MTDQDRLMLAFYGICTTVSVVLSIISIIKAKTKDEIRNGVMWFIASFTPGILLIGIIILLVGFLMLIYETPTWLISKFKKLEG